MSHTSMRYFFPALALTAFLALALTASALGVDMRSGERVEAAGELNDIAFIAARDATIAVQSSDDVLVAARTARIDGARADHLFVAAGDILVTDATLQDTFMVGCQQRYLSGNTGDDLVAAGCRIEILPEFSVNGAAVLAAGEINIEGAVQGGLRAAGGEVRINGPITGAVNVRAEKFILGPRAQISGDLTYHAREVAIAPEAVITGARIVLPFPESEHEQAKLGLGAAIAFAATGLLFLILGVGLLVLVAVAIFPALMNGATRAMRDAPLQTLGAGFAFMALAPVLIGFLFVSVLGIPLALMIGAIYLATAPLAFAAVVYFIGLRVRGLAQRGKSAEPPKAWGRLAWSTLAMAALLLVGFVPLLGGAAWLIAYVIGLGAIVMQGRNALATAAAPTPPQYAS